MVEIPTITMDEQFPPPVWGCPKCSGAMTGWVLGGDPAESAAVCLEVECRHCGHSMMTVMLCDEFIDYEEMFPNENDFTDDGDAVLAPGGRAPAAAGDNPGDGADAGGPGAGLGESRPGGAPERAGLALGIGTELETGSEGQGVTAPCPHCGETLDGVHCARCARPMAERMAERCVDLPGYANDRQALQACAMRAIEDFEALHGPIPDIVRPSLEQVVQLGLARMRDLGVPEIDRETLDRRGVRMAASMAMGLLHGPHQPTPERAVARAIGQGEQTGEWHRFLGRPNNDAVLARLQELLGERAEKEVPRDVRTPQAGACA